MFVRSLAVGPLLLIVFFHGSIHVNSLRCYGCDVASDLGYDEAEKACNLQGAKECPDPKNRACMTEAFTRDQSFQVLKRCVNECPVFLNSTAEHIRCCVQDACNDVMSLDPTDRTAPTQRGGHMGEITGGDVLPSDRSRPSVPPGPRLAPAGVMPPQLPSGGGMGQGSPGLSQGNPGQNQKVDRMNSGSGISSPNGGTPMGGGPAGGGPGRAQKPFGRPDNEMNVRKGLMKSGHESSSAGDRTIPCHSFVLPLVSVLVLLGV